MRGGQRRRRIRRTHGASRDAAPGRRRCAAPASGLRDSRRGRGDVRRHARENARAAQRDPARRAAGVCRRAVLSRRRAPAGGRMTATVRAQNLRLVYGPRAVFDRVDIALYPGTFTAIVGPNGAGKSSLLRLLAGVQLPTDGTIERTAQVMLIASDSAPPPDVTP